MCLGVACGALAGVQHAFTAWRAARVQERRTTARSPQPRREAAARRPAAKKGGGRKKKGKKKKKQRGYDGDDAVSGRAAGHCRFRLAWPFFFEQRLDSFADSK